MGSEWYVSAGGCFCSDLFVQGWCTFEAVLAIGLASLVRASASGYPDLASVLGGKDDSEKCGQIFGLGFPRVCPRLIFNLFLM